MPYLALPLSEPTMDPTVQPQLCLDTASCDADCMIVSLLHHIWCHNTDYAMMPPALQPSVEVPWDIHMEEFLKLWWNTTYISWKVGCPGGEVSIAITLVSTSHREFDFHRLVVDISDETAIRYPVLKVDEDSESDSTVEDNDKDDDYSEDEEDLDEDLQKTVMEVANKTDNSGF